ncbi:hypothetical protein CVIRNUC_010981 [Coccomyxa viridis]|uniref:Dol-P-Glc:Glc(2)Man(9)GlcNAc(2)-PP-Dol alpha-1,2-glucosyltransferase n=1 Tax=Coccomyxa viridis TaxID=1274662 RepID=A0AAV1IP64_9CHLO|nr:hypothetical protein CVIRNUC_010981 [Coccomyxa viridis]
MAQQTGNRSRSLRQESSVAFDAVIITLAGAIVTALFQRYAPDAYMDEWFHVPQTQRYCRGDFQHWDPKITTFPGLYLLAAPYARAVAYLQSYVAPEGAEQEACSTGRLRSINVLLAAAYFVLMQQLHRRLHPHTGGETATLIAVVALLLPTHFLYAFLYYTDVGAVTFILASYLAVLHERYHLGALLGVVAVAFRQTNAVWVAFILGTAVLNRALERDMQARRLPAEKQLLHVLCASWRDKAWLVKSLWSLAAIPAAFAAFVLWNGGVAVGDRAHHVPVLHFMQVFYLLLFTVGCLAAVHLAPDRVQLAALHLRRAVRGGHAGKALRLWGSLAGIAWYCVQHYTLAHPFLLADNRHYTFYLWKDFFAVHPGAKFTLLPMYLYSAWSVWHSLIEGSLPVVGVLGLCTASCLTLIPAWLLDFRYFTVPFVMVLLHMKPPTRLQAGMTAGLFVLADAIVVYIFLLRPFKWHDGSIARFMF